MAFHSFSCFPLKALAKQTCKLMQASWHISLQNQNLRTVYAWTCEGQPNGFTTRLASSHKSQKAINCIYTVYIIYTVDLHWVAKRWKTKLWKNCAGLVCKFELDQNSMQVITTQCKWVATSWIQLSWKLNYVNLWSSLSCEFNSLLRSHPVEQLINKHKLMAEAILWY